MTTPATPQLPATRYGYLRSWQDALPVLRAGGYIYCNLRLCYELRDLQGNYLGMLRQQSFDALRQRHPLHRDPEPGCYRLIGG